MTDQARFFGKYRGTVVSNIDPMQIARIQVQVPDVLGPAISSWAMPCLPIAAKQSGVYCVPQVGAGVWVEFEQGDPDYPIWVGGFWGSAAEVPTLALSGVPYSPNIVLQTGGQVTLMLSDVPGPTGGILLKAGTAMLSISSTGITLTNGMGATMAMPGGPVIDFNAGALTVVN